MCYLLSKKPSTQCDFIPNLIAPKWRRYIVEFLSSKVLLEGVTKAKHKAIETKDKD